MDSKNIKNRMVSYEDFAKMYESKEEAKEAKKRKIFEKIPEIKEYLLKRLEKEPIRLTELFSDIYKEKNIDLLKYGGMEILEKIFDELNIIIRYDEDGFCYIGLENKINKEASSKRALGVK